jgi:hypothetical protein
MYLMRSFVRPQIYSISSWCPGSYKAHITQPQENQLGILPGRPKGESRVVPRVMHTLWDVELDVDRLQQTSPKLPARVGHSPRIVPWWNIEVNCLKASTRRLFNQVKRTGDWKSCETAHTFYNKEMRKAQQSSWRDYLQGIEDVPDRARLKRIMANQPANSVESIKLMANIHNLEKKP